jgi:nitrogen-specific signal transduction histidine kinase
MSRELARVHTNTTIVETVRTLAGTLRHEINNPLGAVLGAAYLLRNASSATAEQREAAQLVEESGKRIKHVLDQLCDSIALESITKANTKVFHIPGDKPWNKTGGSDDEKGGA